MVDGSCLTCGDVQVDEADPKCPRCGRRVAAALVPARFAGVPAAGPDPEPAPASAREPAPTRKGAHLPGKGLGAENWRRATRTLIGRLQEQIDGAEAESKRRREIAERKVAELKAWVREPIAGLPAKREALAGLEGALALFDGGVRPGMLPPTEAPLQAEPGDTPGIVSEARRKRWSRMWERCRKCQRDSVKHAAHGYCMNCYPTVVRDGAVQA